MSRPIGLVFEQKQLIIFIISHACGINIGDSVVITGGQRTRRNVIQYWMNGSYKELANLNEGRDQHGCSSYIDDYDNKVNTIVSSIIDCG